MDTVKLKKDELLEVVRKNRDGHQALFEEALEGYKLRVIEELEQRLADIRAGKPIDVAIRIAVPMNQTKDYNRAIKMFEMSVDDIIELDQVQFSQFVMDDWAWKEQAQHVNAMHSTYYKSKTS